MDCVLMTGLCLCLFSTHGQAEESADIYARVGDTVLTHDMVDAAFAGIDDGLRLGFIRDGNKVEVLLRRILIERILADEARAEGFDQDPLVAGRMELAADKALATAWVDELVRRAPDADYEQMAREYYLLNREQYRTQPSYDVTHLLVSTRDRPKAEARQLAEQLLEEARRQPEQFDALVLEHSEDPGVAQNQGQFKDVVSGRMVAPFERAMKGLQEAGEFSDVVETRYGFHIIRLDHRTESRQQEFDEVKDGLIHMHRVDYREQLRSRLIGAAIDQPMEVTEGATERMLKRYFGENLEKAPDFGR